MLISPFEEITTLTSLTITENDFYELLRLEPQDESGMILHILNLACNKENLDIELIMKDFEKGCFEYSGNYKIKDGESIA